MATETRLSKAAAGMKRVGPRGLLEVCVNIVAPYLVYSLVKPHYGEVTALIASSGPPVLWSIIEFVRRRTWDVISLFVIVGIVLSLAAVAGGGSPRLLLLRERMVTAIIGLAFVVSAAIGRPLVYELARAGMRRNKSTELASFEANRSNAGFRHAMMVMTLVWGCGLMLEAGFAAFLVFTLTTRQYLVAGPIVGYSTMGVLSLWTYLYARYRQRAARARSAAATAGAATEPSG